MQITEFKNAIINFPGVGHRLASFADGVLSIAGLGHIEAMMVIKLIEHTARKGQQQEVSEPIMPTPTPTPATSQSAKESLLAERLGASVREHIEPVPLFDSLQGDRVSVGGTADVLQDDRAELQISVAGAQTRRTDSSSPNVSAVPSAVKPEPEPEPELAANTGPEETDESEGAEPEPPKRKRGRPPGAKNKPKVEPEPEHDDVADDEPEQNTEKRPGMDPTKVDWDAAPKQDAKPETAATSKPMGGAPQVSVTRPPAAVAAAYKSFKLLVAALDEAGLKDEPIIYLTPETVALVNELSPEEGPIEPGQLLNLNRYRWILAHREAIEAGAPNLEPIRLISAKKSMRDLVAQLVRMIAYA